ncbi:FAD-linked oxidoreductase [Allocatelliglobosispora scoriae]|uniref:FAD-linked oxidoreductase n=1 Tax=Allocatelliglobosispora scoriae TaxID=643052 RepID=A0A841BRF2_9ACTN|nr:D-arabinono-1,4-lactone oxidase [Allocatelliglobosispora scoriae]MBB5869978.1 FAD-linked oxidoreductase [Allocatelliglobosispora scoriae]
MSGTWQNWGRSESVTPARVEHPSTVDAVVAAVAGARRDGLRVKPIGAGHSFTGIAVAPGVQLGLARLSGLISVDGNLATFAAGTALHQVPALLAPYELAMENLGDIDAQTLAGATSTGTHGTGARFAGLANQVAAVTLVTADGSVLRIDADHELFNAARLGLGALGVLVEITLRCVPAFKLHAVERPERLDGVLESFLERAAAADHFEFYWFPHTTTALTKTNTRLPLSAESRPLGKVKRWIDDDLMSNRVFAGVCGLGRAVPPLIPPVNRLAQRLTGNREFTDISTGVFTTERRVRFREMEYALPRAAITDALREIDKLITARGWRISFPLEVRVAAPDDIWLSTGHGRDTGYIAIHRYFRENHHEYFQAVERIFRSYEGRPHWGKIHYQDAESLSLRYPRFGDFLAARKRLDPDHLFANDYLDRVLGRLSD